MVKSIIDESITWLGMAMPWSRVDGQAPEQREAAPLHQLCGQILEQRCQRRQRKVLPLQRRNLGVAGLCKRQRFIQLAVVRRRQVNNPVVALLHLRALPGAWVGGSMGHGVHRGIPVDG
jgi:hypothetical protein